MTRKQSNGLGHRAGRVLVETEALGELAGACRHEAPQNVRVAAEVLRGAVHDEVRAELQRPLEVGGGERVVHDGDRAGGCRQPRDGADVDHLQERVRGRLDPHHPRRSIATQGRRDRVVVAQVDGIGPDPVARPDLVRQPPGAAVDVVAHEQPVARLEEVEQVLGRCQARGVGEAMLSALEGRDRRLQRAPGRVVAATVLEPAAGAAHPVLLERGAHLDGGHDRAGLRVRLRAGVDGERLEAVAAAAIVLVIGHAVSGCAGSRDRPSRSPGRASEQ